MSRIRSVHPGLWTDDVFVSMSLTARLFLIGLWNEADDCGLFEWKPMRLKMRLAPADNIDAAAILRELSEAGFIVRLTRLGKEYGAVKNFRKYQRPQKPSQPIIPLDDEIRTIVCLPLPGSEDAEKPTEQLPCGYGSPTVIPPQMEDGIGIGIGIVGDNPPPPDKPARAKKEGRGDFFNRFWKKFPKGPTASETEAAAVFETLDETTQAAIADNADRIAEAVRSEKTSRPYNPARFLSEGRFRSLIERPALGPPRVIYRDSPEGRARDAESLKKRGVKAYWSDDGTFTVYDSPAEVVQFVRTG